jgi:nucleoside-diphosphate-sugar epimerase
MTTVLLTGATGFVGMKILESLTTLGVRVIPVVRSNKEKFIPALGNIERIVSSPDIFQESVDWWRTQCKGIDTVIHAAWYAEPGKYLMSEKNMDCLVGSLNLARGAVAAGVKRWVGLGTCFEYDVSVSELSTDVPLKPLTPYAGTKAALYFGLEHWLHEHSVDFVWCRLFNLYGEDEDPRRLVPYLRSQLEKGEIAELTSGNQKRDFMDVSQAGHEIAALALSDTTGAVNVCSGIPITVREFAEQIAAEYGRLDLLSFGTRPENAMDSRSLAGKK